MNERGGNVIENKGSSFRSRGKSGNVIENTGSYASKAGMLLKKQVVSVWQVVGRRWGKRTGFGFRLSGLHQVPKLETSGGANFQFLLSSCHAHPDSAP